MGLNCCEASGPRGLFLYPLQTVMERKEGVQVNYFAEGTFKFKTLKAQVATLKQTTTYPRSGVIEMVIDMPKAENFEIFLRIPQYSKATKLAVNGQVINDVQRGSYAKISRVWKTGDKITLELDMRGHVVNTGSTAASAAIIRGPIVLARDSRFAGAAITTMMKPYADKDGYINLTEVKNTTGDNILMLYRATFVPEAYTEKGAAGAKLILCDYASAGNGKLSSSFQVWMPQLIKPAEK
ncbi:hypothetical protein [Mucilaginibacter antarcticus]